MARQLLPLSLATLAAGWRASGDARPNLIVYLPDTIRAESLSAYGHPFVRTPNVDRLAAQGTTFEQAHAQHTQCSPSRCALLTGRYMHTLGHRTQTHLIQPYEANLFATLKAANYTTMLLGKNDMFAPGSFAPSLTFWENDGGCSQGGNPYAFGTPGYFSFAGKPGAARGNNSGSNGDLKAVELSARWLRSDPPEPFLLMLSGIGAHPPYAAPLDFHGMYSGAQVASLTPRRASPPGANKPAFLDPSGGIPGYRNLTGLNGSFFDDIAAVYLGRVSYMDYVLGVLLDGIDASPAVIANNTVVVMTSDHGDYAGDWRCVEK